MWLHLDVLVPERLLLFWRYEGKFEVWSRKNGGKLSLLLKVAAGERTGNKHHFAIRYVVAQSCHYQRSVAAVLINVVFYTERLL